MKCLARRFLVALLLSLGLTTPALIAEVPTQTATVVSVREIRRHSGFNPSRYAGPIYFTVDFAFRLSGQSYCVNYETPVLDEVQALRAANGKEVNVDIHGKKLAVMLPSGLRIKADLVKPTQC
jgi:hypothetical protein